MLLSELAKRVITPYIIIAIILVIMAIMIKKSSLPEIASAEKERLSYKPSLQKTSVLQFPHLLLGVLCLFLYVGVEVMAGDAIGTYGKHMGMPLDQTKYFTAFTLFAMLAGYVIGIFTIPKIVSQQKALAISAILGIIFSTGCFCFRRIYIYYFYRFARPRKCSYVAGYFPISNRWAGEIYQDRIRIAYYGYCRRSCDPFGLYKPKR